MSTCRPRPALFFLCVSVLCLSHPRYAGFPLCSPHALVHSFGAVDATPTNGRHHTLNVSSWCSAGSRVPGRRRTRQRRSVAIYIWDRALYGPDAA